MAAEAGEDELLGGGVPVEVDGEKHRDHAWNLCRGSQGSIHLEHLWGLDLGLLRVDHSHRPKIRDYSAFKWLGS